MHRDFKGVWIPKEIWLSTELTLQEKVMLVEIDSLDNEDGCYASNQYFADFLGLSKDRISRIISMLYKKGYIFVELIYKDGSKEISKRIIRINHDCISRIGKNNYTPIGEITDTPIGENADTPIGENAKENNTVRINNTSFNKRDARARFTPPSLQEIKDFAKSRSSPVDPQAFYDYFTAGEWKDSKGNKVKNWKQKFITWENMNGRSAGRTNAVGRNNERIDTSQYENLV
jgi:hypothetical protein